MNSGVDYSKLVTADKMVGEDEAETEQLRAMLQEAKVYIGGFAWCHAILAEFYGLGVAGVVAVFLFEIAGGPGVDPILWVVCGDLPSAYLVTDGAPTPTAALTVYCGLMDDWIAAVRAKGSLSEVFPLQAEPTEANAGLLERRVSVLRNDIIPAFE